MNEDINSWDSLLRLANTTNKTYSDRLKEKQDIYTQRRAESAPIFARLQQAAPGEARVDPNQLASPFLDFLKTSTDEISGIQGDANANLKTLADILKKKEDSERDNFDRGLKVDPKTGQLVQAQGVGLTGQSAVTELYRQGGDKFLKGKSVADQKAISEAILSFGSLDEYRQQAPLESLLIYDKDLEKAQTSAESILDKVNALTNLFPKGTGMDIFGKGNLTGPIASKKGFLRTPEQVRAQQIIGELFTGKAKEMSGVAINPEELKRMETFLPAVNDQENIISQKMENMSKAIEMNMKVREVALRSGKTISQVWKENSKEFLTAYGFDGGVEQSPGIDENELQKAIDAVREQ